MKNKLSNNILAGIISLIPIYVTFWILKNLFILFSNPGSNIINSLIGYNKIKYLPEISGFFLTVSFLFLIGLFVKNILGKQIVNYFEKILQKIPVVSMIYKTIKQITTSIGDPNKQSFKKVVIIQYPRKQLWTLAMVTGESKDKKGNDYYHIFVPTTPNPTSGFMLFSLKADVVECNMSVEEGLKIIISGGMIAPDINNING